ncbi:MAG: S9 family peptidase, partial [Myxococcota bacterium]
MAANPQISPDGARVVYERRAFDIMTDSTRTSLWIIDSDGSNHRPLVADGGSYSSPVFSPDGGRLAYFGTVNETTQIVVRWLDTGESAVLTNLQYAPADLTWSPDGSALAFTMELPADTEPLAAAPKKPEGAQWAPAVKVIESVTYRFDGRGFLEPAHSQVFVVPALGGSPAQLTEGPYHHRGPLSWTSDSSAIVFGANREEDWEYDRLASDLWRVTLADGTLEALTDSGEAQAPVVSPDGSRVAFLSARNVPEPYRNRFLKVLDLEDGTVSTVTADLDRSIETAYWARNGRGLYIVYADQALKLLAYQPLQGERQVLTDAIGGVSLGRPYVSGSASVAGNGT